MLKHPTPLSFCDFYCQVMGFFFSPSGNAELVRPLNFLKNFAQLDTSFGEKFWGRVKLYYLALVSLSHLYSKVVVSIASGEE